MTTNTHIPEAPPTLEGKPKKRGFVWLIAFLIVASVAGYAVYKAGQPGQIIVPAGGGRGGRGGRGAGLGPVPVVVNKVKRTSVPEYDPGLGNVEPYYSVTLKPLVSGQIMSINFQEGDLVKKDQVLFVVDPRPYQVALDQAEGNLARDQAQLTDALKDQARYRDLIKTNAIPTQQLDTQDALVGQLQGTVKTDQANIDSAKLNLVYSKVQAPFDGRCGLRLVDPGNVVQAQTTGLLVIEQVQPIAVDFTIPEDKLPAVLQKLRAGAKLPVEAWNRDNSVKLDTGYLLTMDNLIDNTTGTGKLKAVFENKNEELFPLQFVNVQLLVDTLPNQIVIPSVAIQHGQQGAFVYVVNDQSRVELRPVETGIALEFDTQILSGLKDGEQVVVDGTDRLQNNTQVRIRPASGAAGGSGGRGRESRGSRGGSGRQGASPNMGPVSGPVSMMGAGNGPAGQGRAGEHLGGGSGPSGFAGGESRAQRHRGGGRSR